MQDHTQASHFKQRGSVLVHDGSSYLVCNVFHIDTDSLQALQRTPVCIALPTVQEVYGHADIDLCVVIGAAFHDSTTTPQDGNGALIAWLLDNGRLQQGPGVQASY